MTNFKYRVYHSQQYNWPKNERRFVLGPEHPFKPLGLIIFGAGNAIVNRLIVGNNDQLVKPVPAKMFSPQGFTIEDLEKLAQGPSMQATLAMKGIFSTRMSVVNIGTHITIELSEPVDTILYWGVEQEYIPRNNHVDKKS